MEPILHSPMVKTKYDVQSFLGSCNYYNEFIEKYSIIDKPLTKVLKKPGKEKKIQNFSKQEFSDIAESMKALKKALTSPPILAFTDSGENASDSILGTDYFAEHH